jgi:hypothetical protein
VAQAKVRLILWSCRLFELRYLEAMSTVREIEAAIENLPLPERLKLYKDMPQLIGRSTEDLDWQRLGLENFFQDDSPDDKVYDSI